MPDRKTLVRRLLLAAYVVAAFLFFLLLLFPFDRLKSRIESEVRLRTPFTLSISRISPRFFSTILFSDVVLSNKENKILLESPAVHTSVSIFGLLHGLVALDSKATVYGGDLLVKTQHGPGRQYVSVDANNLDIGSFALLKNAGVKVSGKLGGNFEMTGDAGKGRIWIKGMASRDLKIKGISIPDLDFDQCWLEAELKGDRLTIKKLEFEGKEVKIRATGDILLRERGTINLIVKLKLSERMAQEQAWITALIKNKDAEGYLMFTLGGTLAEPLPRL